jgi:hypothetical protein
VDDRAVTGAVVLRTDGIGQRLVALVAAALLLSVLVLPWRPPTLCLLRGLTGIPCPFCGGTTALVQLGRGDLLAALRASPLAVLGAPLWVAWPRLRAALARRHRTRWSRAQGRRTAVVLGAVALGASELWQLQRFAA